MILFFKSQTTGLTCGPDNTHPRQPWPVQIAAILAKEDGTVVSEFEHIIRPERFTIGDSARFHGITDEIAQEHGQHLPSILVALSELARDSDLCVAHNMAFEALVLEAAYHRMQLPCRLPRARFDTMEQTRASVGLPGRGDFKAPTLAEAHQALCGAPWKNAYQSLDTAHACMRVYFAMQERERALLAGKAA